MELLVVMGIITVLLAILLPVIGRARRAAQGAVCLSNVRQLAAAFTIYVNEHRNSSIPFTFSKENSWVVSFRDEVRLPEKLYRCPALGDETAESFGGAGLSWTLSLTPADAVAKVIVGSYGFNGWLLRWESIGRGGDQFSGGTAALYALPSSSGGERIPVFADATWIDGWPREEDPTPPDLTGGDRRRQGPGLAPTENMMARFTIARHGKAIHASFLDGHAEAVGLERLKRLRWHNDFVEQDWAPALPGQ